MIARFLIACAAALLPAGALAQQPQQRTLEVPASASWQHALTGIILPPRPAQFVRQKIGDYSDAELDVSAHYEANEGGTTATFYIYRSDVPDVALWFDRAVATIARTARWGVDAAAIPAPEPFARTGGSQKSGLLSTMPAAGSGVTSTGVAIVPLGGDWLAKLRMSSSKLDSAALKERMHGFLAELRWPAAAADERAATPIAPCAGPLKLKRAKLVKQEPADVLMSLLTASLVAAKKDDAPPPVYCREAVDLGPHGVYRPDGSKNSYLIAFNDAGLGLSLAPALTLEGLGGGGRSWSMMLLERNSRSAMPSFNRLPPPEQALAVAFSGGPRISTTTGKADTVD